MNKCFLWELLGVLLCVAAFVGCSQDSNSKVAGGTEAESTIAFQIKLDDGKPASMARVRILPQDYLSDGETMADWSFSDTAGYVEFLGVTPGSYTVEARLVEAKNALGAVANVKMDSVDNYVLNSMELKGLTVIEGFVAQSRGTSVLRIAGLERFVMPDSQGYFVIDSLPHGDYEILVENLSDHEVSKVSAQSGDTLFVVDTSLAPKEIKFSSDWSWHNELLASADGYASGVTGGKGGKICMVTTTEDYLIIEDTVVVDDSTTEVQTNALVAPGSLRECAMLDTSAWILFEKSGTYNLQRPLRIASNKTIDGRGRNIRITGMGILTDLDSNLIFENLTFSDPSITTLDTTSRRAVSIHNETHHVWIDHCTFEKYPLIEVDIKRGSYNVTLSWSRFENAQTGILFGLTPDLVVDSVQTFTMHHNYFTNMETSGVVARFGKIHAYNNYFANLGYAGVECSDSASCLVEKNVFGIDKPVSVYRLWTEDGDPVAETLGFAKLSENWMMKDSEASLEEYNDYKPDYLFVVDVADADLIWKVKNLSGPQY
ncbi:MAG: right-handed parallel beta-helix repeat-containing protein [Fibrobacteraceae bacterium]|nr:right-handed parallel beta-helix repeat-containing protein [Fibrobacteraceae bacterium]